MILSSSAAGLFNGNDGSPVRCTFHGKLFCFVACGFKTVIYRYISIPERLGQFSLYSLDGYDVGIRSKLITPVADGIYVISLFAQILYGFPDGVSRDAALPRHFLSGSIVLFIGFKYKQYFL